jgi:hypothetical protein
MNTSIAYDSLHVDTALRMQTIDVVNMNCEIDMHESSPLSLPFDFLQSTITMRRIQGWDPLLIISQIISLQTIHYLLLALLAPPILEHTTNPDALAYAGGPRVTGYILDWREIASRSTAPRLPRHPPGMKRRDGGMEKRSIMDTQELTNGTIYVPLQFEPILQNLYRREMDVPSHYAVINDNDDHYEVWDYGVSYTRGWVLAGLWIFVCLLE